jgi:Uma2 family endonuclease
MIAQLPSTLSITWQKLPESFKLPDDPVDNINQPSLAAALTEILWLAGFLSETAVAITDYGVCVTVNDRIVVKAPDWAYIPRIWSTRDDVERSYTPHLDGEVPAIVLEFLSQTDGGEFSNQSEYPFGKWFFYEQILKVPYYGVFEPDSGDLALYQLSPTGTYQRLIIEENGLYWIEAMGLFLGSWYGEREGRNRYWLRWWDAAGNLLLWGAEQIQEAETARHEAETARHEAEQALIAEQQRREALLAQLRAMGIRLEDLE